MNAMWANLVLSWKGQDGHEIAVYQYPNTKTPWQETAITISDLGETLIEYDDHHMLVYAAELANRQGLNYDSATHAITFTFEEIRTADWATDPKPIRIQFARALDRVARGLAAKKRTAAANQNPPRPSASTHPRRMDGTPDDLR